MKRYMILTRTYSLGRGRGYEHRTALCSRCEQLVAHWLVQCRYHQRYYCDECVKVTKEWKEQNGDIH